MTIAKRIEKKAAFVNRKITVTTYRVGNKGPFFNIEGYPTVKSEGTYIFDDGSTLRVEDVKEAD